MRRITDFVTTHPIVVIATIILVTIVFGVGIRKLQVDPSLAHLLPADLPERINTDRLDEFFGGAGGDLVVANVLARPGEDITHPDTLRRIKTLSEKIERLRCMLPPSKRTVHQTERLCAGSVLSLFTLKDIRGYKQQNEQTGQFDYGMRVTPAVERIPESRNAATLAQQRELIRQKLKSNDLVYGNIVAGDFSVTAIMATIHNETSDHEIVGKLHQLVKEVPGPEEVIIGGQPAVRVEIADNIHGDVRKFLPIGIGIMLVFLGLCFRELRGVMLPFLVVIFSIVSTLGLMGHLGLPLTVVSTVLPVMLIAIANDYGIHLIARYQEDVADTQVESRAAVLAAHGVRTIGVPILLAGLTTIVGLLSLLTHQSPPAQVLGLMAAFGISIAFLFSITLIPAMLAILPVSKSKFQSRRFLLIERLLARLANWVPKHPRAIVLTHVVAAAAVGLGILWLNVDTNPIGYFPAKTPIVRAMTLSNNHFGGATSLSVLVDGNELGPGWLPPLPRSSPAPRSGLATAATATAGQAELFESAVGALPTSRPAMVGRADLFESAVGERPQSQPKPDGGANLFESAVGERGPDAAVPTRTTSTQLEGKQRQPQVMRNARVLLWMDRLERHLLQKASVGQILSLARQIRKMNQALHGDSSAFARIPPVPRPGGPNPVAEYLTLYESSGGNPSDFEHFVSFDYVQGQVMVRIREARTKVIHELVDDVKAFLATNEGQHPFHIIAGSATILAALERIVVVGQVRSLLVSFTLIGLLTALLFRSVLTGLLTAIILSIAALFLFGLMGYCHIDLNIATAMVSSIVIGVGVDYALHFLHRYREERRKGRNPSEGVQRTLVTTGRGIVFNAFSVVVGFSALLVSGFLPVRFFGFLIIVTITGCLVGALVLLPAMCLWLRPRYFEQQPANSRNKGVSA